MSVYTKLTKHVEIKVYIYIILYNDLKYVSPLAVPNFLSSRRDVVRGNQTPTRGDRFFKSREVMYTRKVSKGVSSRNTYGEEDQGKDRNVTMSLKTNFFHFVKR